MWPVMVRAGDEDAIALTLGESEFLKALDIETPNNPS